MSLGQIIRQKREELGLTLDETSRRVGFSKPYLSTIETGKVNNPPGDELLRKLEETLQFETGLLVHIAHMEKLPADVRRDFEESEAQNEHWKALIHKVIHEGADLKEELQAGTYSQYLQADFSNVDSDKPIPVAGKIVPIINNLSAGYPTDFDDMGYPPGAADDYVRCPDLHDPNAFAVRVIGDSMEPKYHHGDIIIFSPAVAVQNGDDCFVRMSDPHETTFKQVFFEEEGPFRLQPRNHNYPPTNLPREKVNGLWRAILRVEKLT